MTKIAKKKATATKAKAKAKAPKKRALSQPQKRPRQSARKSPAARSIRPVAPSTATVRLSSGSASTGEHAERFDRSPYEVPMMDLSEAIALADALLEAAPPRLPPALAEEATHLGKTRDRAKTALGASGGVTELAVEARPFDVAMDRAWETFVRRVQDYAELPTERFTDAPLAAKVYAIVYDLSILKLNYLAEFAQIGARIDALKREDLLEAARTFAGATFVDEVFHCHSEYGKAIGVMDAPQVGNDEQDQGEARLALADAIAEYTDQMACLARAGRPDTWKAVRDALDAITAVRARQARELLATPPRKTPPAHPPVHKKTETDTTHDSA